MGFERPGTGTKRGVGIPLLQMVVSENKMASERESEVAAAVEDDGKQQTVAMENEGYGFRNIL
ncbi:hypothetical protein V1504DRAFT_435837 [Lipomyces starkeyi]